MVGIALATLITNPELAVPVSFAMHFAGDLVPHWDLTDDLTKNAGHGWVPIAIFADLILAVSLGTAFTLYALWVLHNPALALRIFLCGMAAVLPDAISAPAVYNQKTNPVSQLVAKIQGRLQFKAGAFWGSVTQLIVIGVAFLVILSSLSR